MGHGGGDAQELGGGVRMRLGQPKKERGKKRVSSFLSFSVASERTDR